MYAYDNVKGQEKRLEMEVTRLLKQVRGILTKDETWREYLGK